MPRRGVRHRARIEEEQKVAVRSHRIRKAEDAVRTYRVNPDGTVSRLGKRRRPVALSTFEDELAAWRKTKRNT
jgi:hypothetical protein